MSSLKGKICRKPFEYLEIAIPKGGAVSCYACCPTILPKKVGDLKTQSLQEIWDGKEYQEIRESILDGSYRFCEIDLCPEIQSGNLQDLGNVEFHKKPWEINLSYDNTCNLACPSCRKDFITTNSVEDDLVMEKITDQLLSSPLNNTRLIACSAGDPFVSKHFRRLLFNLDGRLYPSLEVQIMTNGVLLNEEAWNSMEKIHQNIQMVCVSLDAAKEETYKITRRGGNWNKLMKNLSLLSEKRQRGELPFLRLDFVVQDHNYQEIFDFIELGEHFKVDQVFFQKITNWGTFSHEEYKARCIYDESHPDFTSFHQIITDERLRKKIVNPGNFGHWVGPVQQEIPFNLKNAIFHSLRKQFRKIKKA